MPKNKRPRRKEYIKNVIVLLSGGLDSSTLAYFVSKNNKPYLKNRVFTLTFDYGQRHSKELKNALRISKEIGAVKHEVIKFNLTKWGGSALTDKGIKIPQKRKLFDNKKLTTNSIPITYVPARNTIFLSFALSFAEAINASEIYIGVNSVDYSGYVDCRKVFIEKFQELAKLATVIGVNGEAIKIKTPLINLTKSQIVKLGERLKVNWVHTWSCYEGKTLACGLCDSCQLRLKGFAMAKVEDPLKYKKLPKFYRDFLATN